MNRFENFISVYGLCIHENICTIFFQFYLRKLSDTEKYTKYSNPLSFASFITREIKNGKHFNIRQYLTSTNFVLYGLFGDFFFHKEYFCYKVNSFYFTKTI